MTPLPSISFGLDVRQPWQLETRDTGQILLGVKSGAWSESVARVRSLPANSPAQKAAKLSLPYATWAGVFSHRSNSALVRHSAQIGIDLDELGEAAAVAVLQTAVADVYCLAAFRSARGEGVRLLFRIPPCTPENHAAAFEQVALHVQRTYGHEPDASGSDVARASFVSFDRGLWFNPAAEVLPLLPDNQTQRVSAPNRCVALYAGQLAVTCWDWYGRHFAFTSPCQDGTAKTHGSLLSLGKAVALHAHRLGEPVTHRIIDAAFRAWLGEHRRQGVALRCSPEEYRRELASSVHGCQRKPWFKSAAEKWLRWQRHADFPHRALPHEKILFAIRQHCSKSGSRELFLGVRDAGLLAGTGKDTGARLLRKLVAAGHLEKLDLKRPLRHAQTFRLLKP